MGKLVRGVNDLATLRPGLVAEWSPTRNGDVTPLDVMSGSSKKAWWLCAKGHEWEAAVANRSAGTGCPYCSGRFAIVGETDLETMNPTLAAEWHPERNGDVTPRDVLSGAHKKAWWLCAKGHEWEAVIGNRDVGRGCPVCSGKQVLEGFNDLATTNPDLAAEWHPAKNRDVSPRDVTSGSNKKAWWLCAQGHEWGATIASRNSGIGCPICSGNQVLAGFNDLATTNPDLAAEWHPTKNGDITPRDVSSGKPKKAWWLCAQGHEWGATIASRNSGIGCPICSGNQVLAGFNDLATTNPDLAAEWHPTKNGDITPRDVSSGKPKKAWWLCSEGHEWETSIGSRHSGGYGCPYCSGRFAIVGETDLATINPDLAAEWHFERNGELKPRDVTSSSNKKAWWLCSEGHEWIAAVNHRNNGRGCPACATGGYDQTAPGYLYLLRKEHLDLQQFGITNSPEDRLDRHRRSGWERLDVIGPADGVWIRETETALGRFFKTKGVLLPRDYPDKFDGFSESWRSDELSFSTCAEMLEALRDWEKKV